jgi:hypothetical protein
MYTDRRFKYKVLEVRLHQELGGWLTPGDVETILKHLAAEEGITPDSVIEISISIGYNYGHITRVSMINPDGSAKIVAYYKFSESSDHCRGTIDDEDEMEEEAPWCIRV